MRKSAQHRHGVVGRGGGRFNRVAVDGIESAGIDLLQVPDGGGHVVAKVVDDALDRSAVEEMPIRIGKLRLENAPNPPPSNGVRQSKS